MSQPDRAVKGHPALQPAPSVEEMTARVMGHGTRASPRTGAVRHAAALVTAFVAVGVLAYSTTDQP